MDDPDGQPFGLAPITLADKPLFDRVFASLAQPITDYSFASNFIWGTSLKLYWALSHRHLCLFANGTGDLTMLLPPLPDPGDPGTPGEASEHGNTPRGEPSPDDLRAALEHCFGVMDAYNERIADRSRSRIEYISDEMLERLLAVRGFELSASPMSGDYVYDMARMIDLAGGPLKSKRHARSKFMRDFPDHRAVPLDEAHTPACLELLDRWRNHGDAAHEGEVTDAHVGTDILRHRDTLACQVALQHWRDLGLKGLALFVGEKLVGFTLGEAVSPTQVSILIEKTHPDYPGAAQFIFSEFCRQCWSAYPECNAGDDWGIPSLRFTKGSYRPTRLLSKYVMTRQARVVVGAPALDDVPADAAMRVGAVASEASAVGVAPGESRADTASDSAALVFRRGTPEDVPALVELQAACAATLEETFHRRQLRYLIGSQRATVTVAETDGRITGWAVGLVRQHRRCRSGRVYALAVRPDAPAGDTARRLADHTLDALAGLDIERVYLEVGADNAPAIELYRQLGFADHRFLPHYYGHGRHGRRMRVKVIAMPLTQAAEAASGETSLQAGR